MIVICDNCHARYLVPNQAIGSLGRRVRCTTCGHEWFQEEETDDKRPARQHDPMPDIVMEPIPESVRPLPETQGTPIPLRGRTKKNREIDKVRLGNTAAGVAVVLLLLAATIPLRNVIVNVWPPSASFYETIGFDVPVPGAGLTFDHVSAVGGTDSKGVKIIRVSGRIINLRSGVTRIPPVIVTMKQADGKVSDHWTAGDLPPLLAPQGEAKLNTSFPLPLDVTVKDVTVSFGSSK